MAGTKKYKLFSAPEGTKAPCAFFNSPAGCRNGANCKFLHTTVTAQPNALNNSEVVSSESSDSSSDNEEAPAPAPAPVIVAKQEQITSDKKKKTKKRKSSSHDDQIFAKPKSKGDKETKPEEDEDPFVKPVKRQKSNGSAASKSTNTNTSVAPTKDTSTQQAPLSSFSSMADTNSNGTKKKTKKTSKKSVSAPDFRNLNLPIASFSIPSAGEGGNVASAAKSEPTTPRTETPRTETSSDEETPENVIQAIQHPLPVSTATGRKWKDIVAKCYEHPEFAAIFSYQKYKAVDIPGDTWVKSKPYGSWCADFPQAIAIDCEMCETTDPVSGKKNPNALCRISVVNAEDPDEVLLDTLVKPSLPVTDYRTFVNGINKEHLEPVQFTLRHAQAFMMALCSEETVILGHAVHNDLAALRMEHYCVGDSALLFKAKDRPLASVSLKDLAMNVMKKEMPRTHDSVNDARTALLCLEHYRQNNGVVEEIERSFTDKKVGRTHHKLFVHRIPKMCKSEHLSKMFQEHTLVIPESVDDIEFSSSGTGKTHVNFKSPSHAGLAFNTLEGASEEDKSGRLQKKVYLRNGDYVRVRKMRHEKDS